MPPRTNGASVPNDRNDIKPLCSPLLCVTYLQTSNLKRYHSKMLKTHFSFFATYNRIKKKREGIKPLLLVVVI